MDAVLGVAGLNTRTARFDDGLLRLFRQGEFTTPLYSALYENPWRTPFVASVKRDELASLAGKPSESLTSAGAWVGFSIRRTLLGNPIADLEKYAAEPSALLRTLEKYKKLGYISGEVPSVSNVPAPVAQCAALILEETLRARTFRVLAFKDVGDLGKLYGPLGKDSIDDADPAVFSTWHDVYQRVNLGQLEAGANDLLMAVQAGVTALSGVDKEKTYHFSVKTVWGAIKLNGAGDDFYPDEPGLLTIDTGGKDTYINGASNQSASNWCSIVIDTDGDDRYLSDRALATTEVEKYSGRKSGDRPGPAGAVLGYAFLFDTSGNDLYRSHRPGLGSGRLGFGVLFDREGNDTYDAYNDSEGFGMFGGGILEDDGGDDKYSGFTQCQGVGLTMGLGYLVDRAGNDTYLANDTVIDFPSAQSTQHNSSMSQGAGYGRRADYLDGMSMAGGVGILYDQAGSDHYSCSVFGQGVGYWEGVGMLWDSAGDDTYDGLWYVQGAAAHYAIGYLEDEAGADHYTATMNMAQGAGHDFSIGILIDHLGDDVYKAPNLSLGAGNANGIGWFVDMAGNDTYDSSGTTLGKSAEAPLGSLRRRALSLGVFMDLGGVDKYPTVAPWAVNGRQIANWTDHAPTAAESQMGVFWDR